MFADDTCCLESDENLDNLIRKVNKYIIFRTKQKKINLQNINVFYDANDPTEIPNPDLITPLEPYHSNHEDRNCRQYKLLGVYLDEHLSLDYHVNNICNKIKNHCTV